MAIRTYDDTLEALAENVSAVKQDIAQANKQRRNQVVDLYGIEMFRQGLYKEPGELPSGYNYLGEYYISLPPDVVYLERFGFKLKFWLYFAESGFANIRVLLNDMDITPFLALQQYGEVRSEITVTDGFVPDMSTEKNYDLLTMASDMELIGMTDEANQILAPTYKQLRIIGDEAFECDLYLYLKYSHLNR